MPTHDIIVRAFELAAETNNIDAIRHRLRREGYANVDAHLAGSKIKSDLKQRFAREQARAAEAPGTAG